MTFDEAIATVSEQPDLCLTGLAMDGRGEWFTVYFLCSPSEASGRPGLACDRVQLFTSRREVKQYDVDSAPSEAMLVDYTNHSAVLERRNAGEQSLLALFPELPDPNECEPDEFKTLAIQAAGMSEYMTLV